MNCQPGSIALIVKGRQANIGKTVYVYKQTRDVDYTWMGYGILPCWSVESLDTDLDTVSGPSNRGLIPDLALQVAPGISKSQATRMRRSKAKADFDAALNDLAQILRSAGDKSVKQLLADPTPETIDDLPLSLRDLFVPGTNMEEGCMFVESGADAALADPSWLLCRLEPGIHLDRDGYVAERPGYYPLPQFKGKYWLNGYPITTAEIAYLMRQGKTQTASYGPYNSKEDAEYRFDVIWEAPE